MELWCECCAIAVGYFVARAPVLLCDCLGFMQDCCGNVVAFMSDFTMALLWDCCGIAVEVV